MYVCMHVYTLFVSHVNDGFEIGIKSDIEFEWMKSDAEKEGKKTTLWKSIWTANIYLGQKNNIWNLLCSNNNYFRSLKFIYIFKKSLN
jgi:hypothetical protein